MKLAVDSLPLSIDHLECMRTIAIHESVSIWSASVGEQEGHLVGCHGHQGDEIPEHVRILEMSLRVSLLSVDKAGEQNGVTDEEDGRVIADQVPVAFLSVELDSESPRISNGICRSAFSSNS